MSFLITISPKERAAGRFVSKVRRAVQKALAEETKKRGLTQSDLARAIGVNRSVVSREIRGHKDLTLGRVAELAWALGRKPLFDLAVETTQAGTNIQTALSVAKFPLASGPMSAAREIKLTENPKPVLRQALG